MRRKEDNIKMDIKEIGLETWTEFISLRNLQVAVLNFILKLNAEFC
jgi:hypothetical protein